MILQLTLFFLNHVLLSHHLFIVYVRLLHFLFLQSFCFLLLFYPEIYWSLHQKTFIVMDSIFYFTFTSKLSFIFHGETLSLQEFHAAKDIHTFNIAHAFPPNWKLGYFCYLHPLAVFCFLLSFLNFLLIQSKFFRKSFMEVQYPYVW